MRVKTTVGTLRSACARSLGRIRQDVDDAHVKLNELAPKRDEFPDVAKTIQKLSEAVVTATRLGKQIRALEMSVQCLDENDQVEMFEAELQLIASVDLG